jgi:hypothetical protein
MSQGDKFLQFMANNNVNATYKNLVNELVEGFMHDFESGGNFATYNESSLREDYLQQARFTKTMHSLGKKVGYTTVSYTIGDWLDADNNLASLFRIHDFYPNMISAEKDTSFAQEMDGFYYDYYNWMIYRTDQPSREFSIPYFSYNLFNEVKNYMVLMSERYPELHIRPDENVGVCFGAMFNNQENLFTNPETGRENILMELRIANSLGLGDAALWSWMMFGELYTPEDLAYIYDGLYSDWTVQLKIDRYSGSFGAPYGTLWDIPNLLGTRFWYRVIDCWLNPTFAIFVYFAIAIYIIGIGLLIRIQRNKVIISK